jgi:hypothetical protein
MREAVGEVAVAHQARIEGGRQGDATDLQVRMRLLVLLGRGCAGVVHPDQQLPFAAARHAAAATGASTAGEQEESGARKTMSGQPLLVRLASDTFMGT